MPVIQTSSGDTAFEANRLVGEASYKKLQEERARQDAQFEAGMQFKQEQADRAADLEAQRMAINEQAQLRKELAQERQFEYQKERDIFDREMEAEKFSYLKEQDQIENLLGFKKLEKGKTLTPSQQLNQDYIDIQRKGGPQTPEEENIIQAAESFKSLGKKETVITPDKAFKNTVAESKNRIITGQGTDEDRQIIQRANEIKLGGTKDGRKYLDQKKLIESAAAGDKSAKKKLDMMTTEGDTLKNFTRYNTLKQGFMKSDFVKENRIVENKFKQIETSFNQIYGLDGFKKSKSPGVQDATLLFAYNKILDSMSVVRESEIQLLISSASTPEKAEAWLKKNTVGGVLPKDMRSELLRSAKELFNLSQERIAEYVSSERVTFKEGGLKTNRIFPKRYMDLADSYDKVKSGSSRLITSTERKDPYFQEIKSKGGSDQEALDFMDLMLKVGAR